MSITTSEQTDKICKALVIAQHSFGGVAKGGDNTFDHYKYAKLEDYIRAASTALAENNLAVLTGVPDITELAGRPTKSGREDHAVRVKLELRLVHESSQWMQVTCWGEGQDRADKATYKAITGARKYGLACLLGMVTTDDPERDNHVGIDNAATKGRRETTPRNGVTKETKNQHAYFDIMREWSDIFDLADVASACRDFARRLKITPDDNGKLSAKNCGLLASAVKQHIQDQTDFAEFMADGANNGG